MVAARCVNVIDATEPYTSKWLILSCKCHLNFLKTKRSFHNLWVSVLRNKMGITHPFPLTTGLLRLGSWNHVFLNRSVPVDAHSTHNRVHREPSKTVIYFHQSSLIFLENKSSLKYFHRSTRPSLKMGNWWIPRREYPAPMGIFTPGFCFYYWFENIIPENSKALKWIVMNNIKYKSRLKGIISIIPIASVIFF